MHRCVDGGFGLDSCPRSHVPVFRDPTYWFEAMASEPDVNHGLYSAVLEDACNAVLSTAEPADLPIALEAANPVLLDLTFKEAADGVVHRSASA